MAAQADQEERVQGRRETVVELSANILFEVLRRVDPVTLAKAGCVNCDFRSVAEEEALWEKLCNDRWPSTKDALVKSIVSRNGGFRKMYANCYPSIVNKKQLAKYAACSEDDDHDPHGRPEENASDFIFIVDVLYGEHSVFSRIVEGIPGSEDPHGWFSSFPFRVDLLRPWGYSEFHDHGQGDSTGIVNESDSSPLMSRRSSGVLKEGGSRKFWKTFCDKMKVSCILVSRRTKLMANLASWAPLAVSRHWLSDENLLLRFGSVLPGSASISDSSFGGGVMQCNISLICSLDFGNNEDDIMRETAQATLKLTELSLQLEDCEGALTNGRESIAILSRALSCPKSTHRQDVMDSYKRYLKVKSEMMAKNIRDDSRLNVRAAIASGIGSCFFFLWLLSH